MYELHQPQVAETMRRVEASSPGEEGPMSGITETVREESGASGRAKREVWT